MNAFGKTVDKTFLSIDQAEDRGFIHRDYISHCLRWSHVIKRMYERKCYQTAIILDIGCGREIPFAKTLYSSKLLPAMYMGVDVGPINDEDVAKIAKTGKFTHKIWEKTNFLELEVDDMLVHCVDGELAGALPNIVISFEVLEHVEPKMMFKMLEHMKSLTSPDARFFISTPNWNVTDCAANHVNEMKYEALGAAFERHGFIVENVYGTFASIRDYEHLLGARGIPGMTPMTIAATFDALREYYDTNFLSCIFAPLFPAQSRNCLWELRKNSMNRDEVRDKNFQQKFPPIELVNQPWSSSNQQADMSL